MLIGATIKKLRRERDITQEQLTEFLGISSKAVSQWERDKTLPDISQLPLLANIFNVTTDELLGVNIEQKDSKIDEICKKAEQFSTDGFKEQEISALRNGLLEYPNSYKIMECLASALFCSYCHAEEKHKNILEEALELALKVVNECTEIDVKTRALMTACYSYNQLGNKKSAVELAMKMPEINRGYLLSLLYEKEELVKFYPKYIIEEITWPLTYMIHASSWCVDENGKQMYTPKERLVILQKVVDIYKILFEAGDFYDVAQWIQLPYFRMADIYAELKDEDNVLECLEKGAEFGIQFDDYDRVAMHTSLVFRGLVAGDWVKDSPDDSYRKEMLLWLEEPHFDFVRQTDRFEALVKSLQIDKSK